MKKISVKKLMRAVDIKRRKDSLTWQEVSNELDFPSTSSIHHIRTLTTGTFTADRLVIIMQWLGVTDIAPFLTGRDRLAVDD